MRMSTYLLSLFVSLLVAGTMFSQSLNDIDFALSKGDTVFVYGDTIYTNVTYKETFDKIFAPILQGDSSEFLNGILYDRVMPIANLEEFNKSDSVVNVSSFNHFFQAWSELYNASFAPLAWSPDLLYKVALGFEGVGRIQVGIINVDFTSIDSNAVSEGYLEFSGGKFYRVSEQSPYKVNHVTVISPLNTRPLPEGDVVFEFGKVFWQASNRLITELNMSFNLENESFTIISGGELLADSITVLLSEGLHRIDFEIIFSDGKELTTSAFVEVYNFPPPSNNPEIHTIQATKPFQGPDEPYCGECLGVGEYQIFYSNPDNPVLMKPCLIVDGIDFSDEREIMDIYHRMDYYTETGSVSNVVDDLNEMGFDVIILNFPERYQVGTIFVENPSPPLGDEIGPEPIPSSSGGVEVPLFRNASADYIERNAKVLEALITEVNATLQANGSTEELVIIGPSMGAIVARFALAEMEQDGEDHNTRLYVSLDGPHKGANIPIAIQRLMDVFGVTKQLVKLNTPAARELLIYHYSASDNEVLQGAPIRESFQQSLESLGFPQACRNIAVTNGNIGGYEKLMNSKILTVFIKNNRLLCKKRMAKADIWPIREGGAQEIVELSFWGNTKLCLPFIITYKLFAEADEKGSLDQSPGGNVPWKTRPSGAVGTLALREGLEELVGVDFPWEHNPPLSPNFDLLEGLAPLLEEGLSDIIGNAVEEILKKVVGGSLLSDQEIEELSDGIGDALAEIITPVAVGVLSFHDIYVDVRNVTFVPTKSSLAIEGGAWSENLRCQDLIGTGVTPFDAYYVPLVGDQPHSYLDSKSVAWVLEEISGVTHNIPAGSVCAVITRQGGANDVLCKNDEATFYVENYSGLDPADFQWEVPAGMSILGGGNGYDFIHIKRVASDIYVEEIKVFVEGVEIASYYLRCLMVSPLQENSNEDFVLERRQEKKVSSHNVGIDEAISLGSGLSLKIYPNPVVLRNNEGEVFWEFSQPVQEPAKFILINARGQICYQTGWEEQSIKRWSVSLNSLVEGAYYWKVKLFSGREFSGHLIVF